MVRIKSNPCSPKQTKYIDQLLIDTRLYDVRRKWFLGEIGRECATSELTFEEAHGIIERLREIKYDRT